MLTILKKLPSAYYIIGVFLLCLAYAFLSNDRLPFKYVDIFDEKSYIEIVKNFSTHFFEQSFNPYYVSRLLMPGIAHFIHRLFGITFTLDAIQSIFTILNGLTIFITLYFYYKIVQFKGYNKNITILGFCFLFVNFFILKLSNYYPILMDLFGFTSGIILYYYYIIKNRTAFLAILIVSMFVFPTTFLIAVSLIASSLISFDEKGLAIEKNFNKYLYPAFALCLLFEGFYLYSNYQLFVALAHKDYTVQSALFLIPVTFILVNSFIFFTIRYILKLLDGFNINRKGFVSPYFIFSLITLITFFAASKFLTVNFRDMKTLSSGEFLFNLMFQAFSFPLKFLITHFIYYGLFVVLIIYYRNTFFSYVAKNVDLFLKIIIILFSIFFILGTETRQFLQFYPFVVFMFLDSIKKVDFSKYQLIGIFTFQLIWSRFWYTINVPEGFLDKALPAKNFFGFPAQRYFQFQGPWLSTNNSLIYGVIFIITFITVSQILKKNSFNHKV